jgi:hypothetical protein
VVVLSVVPILAADETVPEVVAVVCRFSPEDIDDVLVVRLVDKREVNVVVLVPAMGPVTVVVIDKVSVIDGG